MGWKPLKLKKIRDPSSSAADKRPISSGVTTAFTDRLRLTLSITTGTIKALADRTLHSDDTARRSRAGARLFVGCFAFVLLFALPAWSGNLVQVRVGNHPTYTRVVFEFDAPSGYRIERRAAGEPDNSIRVTLDAASRTRNIVSKSEGVESINVDAGSGRAVAHIMTRHAGLPIREMILTDPPRVVLDLMIPGAKPAPQAEVAEVKPRAAEPEAQPEPTAAQPDEVVVVEPEAQPVEIVPEPEVASEPLIEVPDLAIEETPAQAEAMVEVEEIVAEAVVETEAADAEAQAVVGDLAAESAVDGTEELADEAAESAAPIAVIDMADLMGEAEPIEANARPVIPEVPSAREPANAAGKIHVEAGDEAAPFNLKLVGVIAASVLMLLVLVTLVIRSRGSKPDGIDFSALAGEADEDAAVDQASHEGRIPEGGFAMDVDFHEGSSPDDDFEFGVGDAHDDENKPIESAGVATDAKPGTFDQSDQKEDAMSMDNQDLPTSHMDSEAPTQLGIGAAAVGADTDSSVAHLLQEFERRFAHMEARLDESNEARERLERQVEAQAEELRVQRAAIARTQRAVRSLNRPEEEQATEPALRDPSTPTG